MRIFHIKETTRRKRLRNVLINDGTHFATFWDNKSIAKEDGRKTLINILLIWCKDFSSTWIKGSNFSLENKQMTQRIIALFVF